MKKAFLVLGILIGLGVFVLGWWNFSLSPLNSVDKNVKVFVVGKGDGIKEIAKKLHEQKIIRDQVAFFLMVRKEGLEKKIQAGSFKLSPAMTAFEIANKLTVGTEDMWVTIPEGWRSEQILQLLGQTGDWTADEGKYFPETYLVPKEISTEDFRQLLLKTFKEKVPSISKEQLIVASLIEREGKNSTDRPLISSVIYNRLKIGMSLDIDATVQYALGYWKKDLTMDDLKIKSPYNTYQNPGLPPAPICNPGLPAIEAAMNPARSDYLFYIHDKNGVAHFAKTLSEHNANVAKYLE